VLSAKFQEMVIAARRVRATLVDLCGVVLQSGWDHGTSPPAW